eukprot:2112928-Alexandrium_andersonii.AAC.1
MSCPRHFTSSHIDEEIQIETARRDHFPLIVRCVIPTPGGQGLVERRKPICDTTLFSDGCRWE